jgi:hypothetical protein
MQRVSLGSKDAGDGHLMQAGLRHVVCLCFAECSKVHMVVSSHLNSALLRLATPPAVTQQSAPLVPSTTPMAPAWPR